MKYFRNFKVILLVFLFTIPTFYTLVRPGFFWMQDDLQAFRIHQMDKCFQDFQIPCRWVPDAGNQYGYPQFNYYPPSVYYLGELIHLLNIEFVDSVKILFVLGLVLSSLAMYLLLNAVFGQWPAFVGAMLYTYVPYKAVEVYVRGAMSEFWSLVIFPIIFWSVYQFVISKKIKYLGLIALSTGALLITHNLMSMIFFPVVGIWTLALLRIENKWKLFPWVLGAGILGVGLAAFFTLPVIFEGKYVHIESLTGGYFGYQQHFVNLKQLFFSNFWDYGSSEPGSKDGLSLSTGTIQWPVGILALLLAVVFRKNDKKLSILTLIIGVTLMLVLFLTHVRSSFIWEYIGILEWLQFPWRFLTVSIFLLSILSAAAMYFMKSWKYSKIVGIILIIGVMLSYGPFYTPREWYSDVTDKEKFSGVLWEKELTISIFDYLPIYSKLPPTQKAPSLPEVLEGEAVFNNYQKGSNYQYGEINASKDSLLRLPLFDFPGMEVKIDGKKVNHWHDDCRDQEFCLGLITFNVPMGVHSIRAELKDTPIRTVANSLSLISIIAVIFIFYKGRKNAGLS